MEKLKYYLDTEHNALSAYNKETEFFADYNACKKAWQKSSITFAQFKHDYFYKEITKEEAEKFTGGVLPEKLFEEYVAIIKSNRGEQ